jgi:chromosome segregation ATPase
LRRRNSQIANLTAKQADTEAALAAARNSLEERLGALQLTEGQLAMAKAQNQSAANRIDALRAETTASKAEIAKMTRRLGRLAASY